MEKIIGRLIDPSSPSPISVPNDLWLPTVAFQACSQCGCQRKTLQTGQNTSLNNVGCSLYSAPLQTDSGRFVSAGLSLTTGPVTAHTGPTLTLYNCTCPVIT